LKEREREGERGGEKEREKGREKSKKLTQFLNFDLFRHLFKVAPTSIKYLFKYFPIEN